jgi:uncharacterized phiE125 gp8 family phage protein
MSLYLLTPPAAEPVEVDDAKLALRIDGTEFDVLLPGLIASARQVAEQQTGRAFVAQTWRAELDDWPEAADLIAVYRPSACAVTYWNGSTWASLSGSAYVYAAQGSGTVLAPALTTSWPTLGDIAIGPRVRIDLTAGVAAASADTVPECVKTFVTALVGQLIQSPQLTAAQAVQDQPLLARLLDSQRLY